MSNEQYNYLRPNGAGVQGVVTYNGVAIDFANIESLTVLPVKDASGSDTMWYSADLRISGIVFRDTNKNNVTTNDQPVLVTQKIRSLLMLPRRRFAFKIQDTVWLSSSPETQVAKGPEPGEPVFTDLVEGAWSIEWDIKIPFCEAFPGDPTTLANPATVGSKAGFGQDPIPQANPSQAARPLGDKRPDATFNPIASLRWKSTHTIDERNYSTLSYAGRIQLRAAPENAHPDEFRRTCTPPVPAGFLRKNSQWVIAEAGDGADFSYQDVEQPVMPPDPAWKWSGQCVEAIQKMGGIVNGAVSVHLEGDKFTKKSDLVRRAVAICFETLKARGLQTSRTTGPADTTRQLQAKNFGWTNNGNPSTQKATPENAVIARSDTASPANQNVTSYFVTGGEIRDTLHDNIVDVLLMGRLAKSGGVESGLPFDLSIFDTVIPSLKNVGARTVAPGAFGNIPNLRCWAALMNDPSLNRDFISPGAQELPTQTRTLKGGTGIGGSGGGGSTTSTQTSASGSTSTLTSGTKSLATGGGRITVVPALSNDLPTVASSRFYDSDAGSYDEYDMEVSHRIISGRIMMASSAPGLPSFADLAGITPPDALSPSSAMYLSNSLPVRLHNDVNEVEIFWNASKVGGMPRLPVRDSADPNLVFLEGAINIGGLGLTVDQLSGVQRVSGMYVYGVKDPSRLSFFSPFYPWINIGPLASGGQSAAFPTYDPLANALPTAPAGSQTTHTLVGGTGFG